MTRSQQRLLAQLATSDNELASGLGQCLEALRLISALPRASPVFVEYTSAPSHTIKAFGREHLSRVPLRTVITLIKTSLALPDPIRVTTALFYREDGTIDPTPVLVDEDSWKEIAPYVYTLHVEDELERPLTAYSTLSTVVGSTNGPVTPGATVSRGSGLNSNASAFVPSGGTPILTTEGPKFCKPTFSPSSSQPVMLSGKPQGRRDNTGHVFE